MIWALHHHNQIFLKMKETGLAPNVDSMHDSLSKDEQVQVIMELSKIPTLLYTIVRQRIA